MIFWKLFYTFLKIGLFTFGGGYTMIALIQNEVVVKNAWLSSQEFTDIVATSQITPGPIGINTATFAGYTAVVNTGLPSWMGVMGALLASFSVILFPFIIMILVSKYLQKHQKDKIIACMLTILRLTIVGLIAAAALLLATPENFGSPDRNLFQFVCSILIFIIVFFSSLKFKISPILLILSCGILGIILYL